MARNISDVIGVFLAIWAYGLMLHFFIEALWIAEHNLQPLEPCRHWWCPQTWVIKLKNVIRDW